MIQKHIDELAEKIDLVLITEYFDESLVLLKRELCWELDDVVYFKLNQRSKEYKQANITDQQQVKLMLSALFNFQPHCLFAYLVSVPMRDSNQYLIQLEFNIWNQNLLTSAYWGVWVSIYGLHVENTFDGLIKNM